MSAQVIVDPEFHGLIPPLTDEEKGLLRASLIKEGCRDHLVVWEGILLDGHNRLEICQELDMAYWICQPEGVHDREEAKLWIIENQLARRNLTPDQISILRGQRYNWLKKKYGGQIPGSGIGQNVPSSTAEQLGKEYSVSDKTIKRDGQVARYLDKQPEDYQAVLRGEKKLSDVRREMKRKGIVEKLEDIKAIEVKAIEGIYDVIVIDPPWPVQKIERDERPNQSEFDYPTMPLDELKAFDIPCADDCHVWLWTTQRFLPKAFDLLEAWGLKYICAFVWHKPGGFQPYNLPQYNAEFALYARSGSPSFIDTKAFPVCFEGLRGEHSRKPDEFYGMVKRVTAGRRLDMFGRREIDGFDSWGKEA